MTYAIRLGAGEWVEIPRDAWLKLERQAGFVAQHKGEPATASWGATMPVQGTTLNAGLFAEEPGDSPDEEPGSDEPRDYYFTFGAEIPALEHKYVRIHDTWLQARLRMNRIYGFRWCSQYDSAEAANVERYGLTEIPLPSDLLEQSR